MATTLATTAPRTDSSPLDDDHLQTRRAVESGDVVALARLRRSGSCLRALEGVNVDAAAARGQLDAVRLLCEHAHATFTVNAVDGAARNGHLRVVQYLIEKHGATFTADALDLAALNGHWSVALYLQAVKLEPEWELVDADTDRPRSSDRLPATRVLDAAALEGRLDLVQTFHEHRLPCTRMAMDSAAALGHLEVVQFLHTHRREGCSTRAMDQAAKHGHADVVRFLHFNRTEGCTTKALDFAAANGDLELVTFLHTRRTEGCTTDAVDGAAANGHVEVVAYLLQHRTEGFTCRAVEQAAQSGCAKQRRGELYRRESSALIGDRRHVEILRLLYHQRPDLFDPSVMPALLLCGAFDLWLEMKQAFPDEGGEEQAMRLAGERGHLSTIRFLRDVCGRRDLLPVALKSAALERPSWHAAISLDDPERLDSYNELEDDEPSPEPPSFFLDEGVPDWMIEQSLIDFDLRQQRRAGDEYPCQWTWPIWAIYRHDLATLETLKTLEAAPHNMSDPRFSFDGARAHTVRVGRLDMVVWLFREICHVAVEPTLLDVAVCYGQLEIAKWLAQFQPGACQAFPGAASFPLAPQDSRLTATMLDEIESDPWLAKHVDFGALAALAAEQGNLTLLQRLYARHEASVLARTDILDRVVELNSGCCDLTVLQYLKAIGYTHASPRAMDSVASDSQLELLRFLHEHYAHGGSTARGLLDAAECDSWGIVLFHLRQRGLSAEEREEIDERIRANATAAWAAQLSELLRADDEDDKQLAVEWISDVEP